MRPLFPPTVLCKTGGLELTIFLPAAAAPVPRLPQIFGITIILLINIFAAVVLSTRHCGVLLVTYAFLRLLISFDCLIGIVILFSHNKMFMEQCRKKGASIGRI